RTQMKYNSFEELKFQIYKDIQTAKKLISTL
ncbi:riboflavin kinase, partial [Francisella tularensis]